MTAPEQDAFKRARNCAGAALLGLAVAAAAAAEAGACTVVYREPDQHPFYAHIVRQAGSIDLVRVVSVTELRQVYMTRLPDGEAVEVELVRVREREPDLRVEFESILSIKGEGAPNFHFDYRDPYRQQRLEEDRDYRRNDDSRDGHSRPGFWMDVSNVDGPFYAGCSGFFPLFREQETYLVFRDESGRPQSLSTSFGRNFLRIDRMDDQWLAAVRTLAANPEAEYAFGTPASEFLTSVDGIGAVVTEWSCPAEGRRLEYELLGAPGELLAFKGAETPLERQSGAVLIAWHRGYNQPGPVICPDQVSQGHGFAMRNGCTISDRPACTAVGRTLRIPRSGGRSPIGPGANYYYERVYEITADDHVVITQDRLEFELTGDLRPSLSEVREWFSEARTR
ncbi:MAG: hypothetical protein KIS81_04300 [Maricaulaceae bacterium]|nr:hypothetical protein [Maricaulaceae bacterium]